MGISYSLKQHRKSWRKKNRNLMQESEFDFTWLAEHDILCNGYVFNLHTGTWHKKGKGKRVYGESAYAFIKFLKKENLKALKAISQPTLNEGEV